MTTFYKLKNGEVRMLKMSDAGILARLIENRMVDGEMVDDLIEEMVATNELTVLEIIPSFRRIMIYLIEDDMDVVDYHTTMMVFELLYVYMSHLLDSNDSAGVKGIVFQHIEFRRCFDPELSNQYTELMIRKIRSHPTHELYTNLWTTNALIMYDLGITFYCKQASSVVDQHWIMTEQALVFYVNTLGLDINTIDEAMWDIYTGLNRANPTIRENTIRVLKLLLRIDDSVRTGGMFDALIDALEFSHDLVREVVDTHYEAKRTHRAKMLHTLAYIDCNTTFGSEFISGLAFFDSLSRML